MTSAENRRHSRQCAYAANGFDPEDECHCPDPPGPDTPRLVCGHPVDGYCTCYLLEYVDPSDFADLDYE